MKTLYVAAVSLAAGAVLGAAGVQVLHAQAKPPVYQVTLQEVSNLDALIKEFVPAARAAVKQYGGVQEPPPTATVHFCGDDPQDGPILRYTTATPK